VSAARSSRQGAGLAALRADVDKCRRCELYRHAHQAVCGEGPVDAQVVMVGEQPGDHEDVEGHVFVGPAGRLLDKALAEAGLDRDRIYLTNAVKHFKFTERGKRRIHQQPRRSEVLACLPWLQTELDLVRPQLVVVLGAVAAKAMLGPSFKLTAHRGEVLPQEGYDLIATVHPSAVLRASDRAEAYSEFVDDLLVVKKAVK
jgi:uracil-DNA glycosylase